MTVDTANKMMDHHNQCGSFEFTKSSSLLGDPTTLDRYYSYRCAKCQFEIREAVDVNNHPDEQKKAA